MKTCIKMSNNNVYVVEDMGLDQVAARLGAEDFIKIPGTKGREDFYINSLQVVAVYPAREE